MKQVRLSDVLAVKRIDRDCKTVTSKYDVRQRAPAIPYLRPYSIEVQNAAAARRIPVPRCEWENYWLAEREFAGANA